MILRVAITGDPAPCSIFCHIVWMKVCSGNRRIEGVNTPLMRYGRPYGGKRNGTGSGCSSGAVRLNGTLPLAHYVIGKQRTHFPL
jgi:hypothetical protein